MMAFLVFRYTFSHRHLRSLARIVLTTALSLSITLLVIAVMDYLQEGRMDRIRSVQSFDLTVPGDHAESLRSLFPGSQVFTYAEEEALLSGRAVTVRYISDEYDGGLNRLSGDFSSLAVPYSIYFQLDGGEAVLTRLQKGRSGAKLPRTERLRVSGIYSTALGNSFDDSHVFLPLEEGRDDVVTAVKGAGYEEAEKLRAEGFEVTAWKERESGLYAAFLLERTMMYVMLCFLFVIILVSLKSSVRLFYQERRRERAELEVLGLGRGKLSLVFMLSFLLLMLLSLLSGVLLFVLLRPVTERLITGYVYTQAELPFPADVFLLLSFSVLAVTALLCLWYRTQEGRLSLQEVLSDAGFTA